MAFRTLMLVDGENLVHRYEAMIKDGRRAIEDKDVTHEPGRFLWRLGLTRWERQEIVRVSYFTTVVGDETAISELEERISSSLFVYAPPGGSELTGYLCPRVFKKQKTSPSTKSVDINITVDALRHAYNRSVDRIVLLSGDGDFVPLIQEVMRQGVQLYSGAFSSGLNPQLKRTADAFLDLDRQFFQK